MSNQALRCFSAGCLDGISGELLEGPVLPPRSARAQSCGAGCALVAQIILFVAGMLGLPRILPL